MSDGLPSLPISLPRERAAARPLGLSYANRLRLAGFLFVLPALAHFTVVPLAVDAFGIFLMRQYILDLPDSLIEAARLDGCTELGIYWRIVLPNCKPALAALAVLSFRENWDQFLWPLVIISKEALKTFPLGLAQFEGFHSASYHEMMAAAVVGMVPMILLFLLFQRAFVRGLTLTGLKE